MSSVNPLYLQPNPLHLATDAPIRTACAATCGANAGDLRFTDLDSVSNVRTRAAKAKDGTRLYVPITRNRVKVGVKPCSGYVEESRAKVLKSNPYSKKDLRKLACSVLRDRGMALTEKNIAGILSGKTL
jgi:hypothetical protein